jgi:hypothetical protein
MSESIHSLLDNKNCKIISTCRLQIFNDVRLRNLPYFKDYECNLNSVKATDLIVAVFPTPGFPVTVTDGCMLIHLNTSFDALVESIGQAIMLSIQIP